MLKTVIAILALLLVYPATATEPPTCPAETSALNAPNPVIGTHPLLIGCDAAQVPDGHLNECGVLRIAAQTYPDIAPLLKENEAFMAECRLEGGNDCSQGKYTQSFITSRLRASAEKLWELNTDPRTPGALRLDLVCGRLTMLPKPLPKPGKATFLSRHLTLTRDVSDPLNKDAKSFEAPFMVNASQDRESDKSLIGLYGTVGYIFRDVPGSYALTASAKIDSAAGSERTKSNVAIGLNWSRHVWSKQSDWLETVHLRLSPNYLTDRAFDRKAYELAAAATFTSKKFFRAGYVTCPGGCNENSTSLFHWSPTLAFEAGHVNDAAGVSKLEAIKEAGTYVRLAPGMTLSYRPMFWTEKLSVRMKYTHRIDLNEGWDRGLGSVGINYSIGTNAFWSLAWQKGRQDGSFEPIDILLFGIGIRQLSE